MTQAFDYIIVGSGSAGCLLANRLSRDPQCRVLVLEAGPMDRNFWLKLPVGYFKTVYDERFSRTFKTEPGEGDGHRGIDWPRGRIVGGSSSINGLIFIRGQSDDFNDWSQLGAAGWGYDDVLPHFKALESWEGGASELRGGSGEMTVSGLRNDHPCCRAWLDAAQEYGLPFNDDFNGETTYGVGAYQLSITQRWRASASRRFLYPVLKRPNLTLTTEALVSRVLIENGRAIGVEWTSAGKTFQATADGEVILAAGTVQSRQVLQLSGIGPADHLRSLDIPVVVDAPEVGGNLQDHYQMRTIVRMKDHQSLNDDVRNPLRLARMGMQWLFRGYGPLTVGAGQVGGAACTRHAIGGRPDVQFNVMPLSADKPGKPLHRYSGFTASVWQCHPESRGHVRIVSKDPARQPAIAPNYFDRDIDRKTIVDGVRILREIYRQPSFRDLWDDEIVPGDDIRSEADVWDQVRQTGGTVFHCVGTCRMGSDERSVVDPSLKVRGIESLRVVDASVMPKITSANTNAATLMIAEKAAGMISGS